MIGQYVAVPAAAPQYLTTDTLRGQIVTVYLPNYDIVYTCMTDAEGERQISGAELIEIASRTVRYRLPAEAAQKLYRWIVLGIRP